MILIALQMLVGDRGKYMAMIIGITFASLIMTQQPAIFWGLMNRTYGFMSNLELADIWVMDPTVEFIEEFKPLRDTELQRVRGVAGVAWAVPLFKGMQTALMPDGSRKSLDLTGLDDATLIGAPRVITAGRLEDLRREDGIIVDQDAAEHRFRQTFADGTSRPLQIGDVMEINDRRALVVGLAKVHPSFTTFPQAFTTYSRALGFMPSTRRVLSYILVKAKPGVPLVDVARALESSTGLAAYTRQRFADMNWDYWATNTGIPINFGISVLLGFLVGAVIAGQSFLNFVRESMRAFGTLKAMGLRNATLTRMVLVQAGVVGGIGYGLGVGLSALFGIAMRGNTALAFYLPWSLLATSAGGVLLIVGFAALFGLRKVLRLDPATVFRS